MEDSEPLPQALPKQLLLRPVHGTCITIGAYYIITYTIVRVPNPKWLVVFPWSHGSKSKQLLPCMPVPAFKHLGDADAMRVHKTLYEP